MRGYICGRFIDNFVIFSRGSRSGAVISQSQFEQLASCSLNGAVLPDWAGQALAKIGYEGGMEELVNNILFIRQPQEWRYGKASYEITNRCNYRCQHCYLGRQVSENLSYEDKKKVIDWVIHSGAIWLQITGGEPLLDRDFPEIYDYAYSQGLLLNLSTNGSLLTKERNAVTLLRRPPYRIAVSMYGASAHSYEKLTRSDGSFDRFMDGLAWLKKSGIRTRLNIILTRYNEAELDQMVRVARDFGFEHHVFSELIPALDGEGKKSCSPESCVHVSYKPTEKQAADSLKPCYAGKHFFHIDAGGNTFICKIARDNGLNIVDCGTCGFKELESIAEKALIRPALCQACDTASTCPTCAPIVRLYLKGGDIPSYICPTLNSPERR